MWLIIMPVFYSTFFYQLPFLPCQKYLSQAVQSESIKYLLNAFMQNCFTNQILGLFPLGANRSQYQFFVVFPSQLLASQVSFPMKEGRKICIVNAVRIKTY